MRLVSEKWCQAKEGFVSLFKTFTIKPFEVEILFWCNPRYDNSFYHFQQVADILDDRMTECTVGEKGEFIARYKIKVKERNEATREAQKICDLISGILGKNFSLKHYQVK